MSNESDDDKILDCGHNWKLGWFNFQVWGEGRDDDSPRFRICERCLSRLFVSFPPMYKTVKTWIKEYE